MSSGPGTAIPGSNVPANALVATGGAQGVQGVQGVAGGPGGPGPIGPAGPAGGAGPAGPPAYTITAAAFTVPSLGGTVVVQLADVSWCVLGEMVAVQNAGNAPTQAGTLQITAINTSAKTVTLLNPTGATTGLASTSGPGLLNTVSGSINDYVGGDNNTHPMPGIASPTQSGLVNILSGAATDYIGGDNICHALPATSVDPFSMRLRSFNALGNPNFTINQMATPTGVTNPASNVRLLDRWIFQKSLSGAAVVNAGQAAVGGVVPVVPGTNYQITNNVLFCTVTTQQASLGASDYLAFIQYVEGIRFRQLKNDLHSISLLCQSTVAGMTFGVTLRTAATPFYSINYLCTIPNANQWTLIPLPAIPIWPSGGTWGSTSGTVGYMLWIVLAAGSTFAAPANGVWAAGNYLGAAGQQNFLAQPVSSQFQCAMIQHEPGSQCTTFQDVSWEDAYKECCRYYQKSAPYATAPLGQWQQIGNFVSGTTCRSSVVFPVRMAKTPTIRGGGSPATVGTLYLDGVGNVSYSTISAMENGIFQVVLAASSALTTPQPILVAWDADTGW